jgi:hypothetical protein
LDQSRSSVHTQYLTSPVYLPRLSALGALLHIVHSSHDFRKRDSSDKKAPRSPIQGAWKTGKHKALGFEDSKKANCYEFKGKDKARGRNNVPQEYVAEEVDQGSGCHEDRQPVSRLNGDFRISLH